MIPTRNIVAVAAAIGFATVIVHFSGKLTEAALVATIVAPATEISLRPDVRARLYGSDIDLFVRGTVIFCFTISVLNYTGVPWYVVPVVVLAMFGMLGIGFENGLMTTDADDG